MMYERLLILVLCLCWTSSSLAAKTAGGRHASTRVAGGKKGGIGGGHGVGGRVSIPGNGPPMSVPVDWSRTNTMSKEPGEPEASVKPSEIIDIDDENQGTIVEGSGGDQDDDHEDTSGNGPDDEDGEGSGGSGYMSECQRLRDELNVRNIIGAYIPKCTAEGDFERMQCRDSTGECWCVDVNGREIKDTKQRAPSRPKCDVVGPAHFMPTSPPKRKPPKKIPPTTTTEVFIKSTRRTTTELSNVINPNPDSTVYSIATMKPEETKNMNGVHGYKQGQSGETDASVSKLSVVGQPGLLAAIIGGAVVGLLCAVLLVMFIVYRMRKKDEGSYALDEPKRSPTNYAYQRNTNKEFYA